jgi:hypothetical protein
MPTLDDFASDHSLFPSGHADGHEERGTLLLLNASILVLTASLVAMAVLLSWGNPVKALADITASLTNISALQAGSDRSTPTIPSAPTTQQAADAQALPPTGSGAPTRNEVAVASEPADHGQISGPTSEALFKQFQAWEAKQDAPAQVEPVQPIQDAPAQVVQNAPGPAQPRRKHPGGRRAQDARAEIRPAQRGK